MLLGNTYNHRNRRKVYNVHYNHMVCCYGNSHWHPQVPRLSSAWYLLLLHFYTGYIVAKRIVNLLLPHFVKWHDTLSRLKIKFLLLFFFTWISLQRLDKWRKWIQHFYIALFIVKLVWKNMNHNVITERLISEFI